MLRSAVAVMFSHEADLVAVSLLFAAEVISVGVYVGCNCPCAAGAVTPRSAYRGTEKGTEEASGAQLPWYCLYDDWGKQSFLLGRFFCAR